MRSSPRHGLFAPLLVLVACGGAPVTQPVAELGASPSANIAPEWVVNGISDAHPDAKWLQAVGAAEIGASVQDARERAEFKARGGLVRNLSSTVRSLTESHELFEANDSQSRLQVSLDQTVQVVGEGTLEGARPVDFFVDEKTKTAFCLLVLERAPAAREMARRVAQREADAAALLSRAKTSSPASALAFLADAYDHILAARLLRVSYSVLASGPLVPPDSIGDQVLAALRAASSDLTLHVEAGQGQLGRVGGELPTPMVVQLRSAQGRGIDGVLLGFQLRGKASAELSPPLQTTANEGRAAFFVRKIGASGERSNQVEAHVEALRSRGLPGPQVIVEYLLPTAADTRVLVSATAQAYGEVADASGMQTGVVAALAKAGFAVVPSATLAGKISDDELASAAPPLLCERLRGSVDYVLRVSANAQDTTGRRDRMRARTSAVVAIVDLRTGQMDQFLSDPVDGVADNHAQAATTGLRQLGAVVGDTIVLRVRARAGL